MIIEPWPEIRYLLFEASSQAKTSGGIAATRRFEESSTCFTASVLTLAWPLASTRSAPNEWNIAPTQSIESVVCPRPRPIGLPAFFSFSAATTIVSQFQLSASLVGALFTGYIDRMSMPACCLNRSSRAHGGFTCVPVTAGTPIHLPTDLHKNSAAGAPLPYSLTSGFITSSIGSTSRPDVHTDP